MITKEISTEDLYFHLMDLKRDKNKNELEFRCKSDVGSLYTFVVENWELGYDFYVKLENFCEEWYDEEDDEEDDEKMNKDILLHTYIYLAQKIEKWKKLKGGISVRPTPSTLCNICKHRISQVRCEAFPSGIPHDLYNKPHFEKHHKQENDIVFELGEEGSKNAEIKPLKDYKMLIVIPSPQSIEKYENIKKGLAEEEWSEK